MELVQLLQNSFCGALATAGCGGLFNIDLKGLPCCFASGALALVLRTIFLGRGWGLEAASFVAAMQSA